MAQVYRAHDRLLDRPVALKVLFPELSVDRAFVERFRREAQAAANLSHPNIVPVFDWGEDGGTYFIVMEFVDGQPLSQALRAGGPMPPVRVAQLGAQVAAALSYAHRHGVIHRDVKPGNVLLTEDQQAKVTDFGIARAVNTEESLTQTGAVMGTATYFSPEQAEGIGVDSRSDIYSLGVVLYEMVAGRPPFLGDTPVSIASKHVRDRPPLLRDLNPTVPPALEAVIAKAMAKSPDLRYQTAADLQADLRRFVEGRPVTAVDVATTAMLADGGLAPTGVVAPTGVSDATGVMDPVHRTQAVPVGDGRGAAVRQDRSHVGRWVALLVALLVALAVIVYFVLSGLGYIGGRFAMPTVHGDTYQQAVSALNAKGLDVAHRTTRLSTTVKKTRVISSTPGAGSRVAKGDHVTLVVSAGPVPRVPVPDVKTQPYSSAVIALRSVGLRATEKTQQPSTRPTGTVLSQTPPAGTKVKKDATVYLTVSAQSIVVVPSVVGLAEATAGNSLGTAGLKSGQVTSTCSTKYTSGIVTAQTPKAGTKVKPATKVNLTVSNGRCKVTVPDVVRKPETPARATLAAKGFGVNPVTTTSCASATDGIVVSQTPGAGPAPKGSTVTIDVCAAPTTTTTTKPGGTTKPGSTTKPPGPGGTPPHNTARAAAPARGT
jgi:beta-lactam-binding protein with PASTA domain